jgi:hypothetical protein
MGEASHDPSLGFSNILIYTFRHIYYTTAANERLQSVFVAERQTFPIESAGHVGLTPLRKPLFKCLLNRSPTQIAHGKNTVAQPNV